jgi:predicted RNase H-like nuclease (RuvC/YqgF family)
MVDLQQWIGKFLPPQGETCFRRTAASDVAAWLRRQGYNVTEIVSGYPYGSACTKEGFRISTNGYVSFTAKTPAPEEKITLADEIDRLEAQLVTAAEENIHLKGEVDRLYKEGEALREKMDILLGVLCDD